MPTTIHRLWHRLRGTLGFTRAPSHPEFRAVADIRRTFSSLKNDTDLQLAARIADLRATWRDDDRAAALQLKITATFALVSEAVRRSLGLNCYDVQLLAGLALANGNIAEMQTGEGKTLVTLFPAVWHALAGRGVHVMTTNDYLAGRDARQLAPVCQLLGLSVGCVSSTATTEEKQLAYTADITFGPGFQFGFDYLQDQLLLAKRARRPLGSRLSDQLLGLPDGTRPMQRGLYAAIVDEADSVMLDEATTPLIISAPGASDSRELIDHALHTADSLVRHEDFVYEPALNHTQLTARGEAKVLAALPREMRDQLLRPWSQYVGFALHARHCLARDVHYVVRDEKIRLVDTCTGRIFSDRSWQEGLHQTIEAKEGLPLSRQRQSLARISRQRLAGLYEHLCGMTGTASGSQREFWRVYGLPVVVIPTHRPCLRETLPAGFFASAEAKFEAVARETQMIRNTGRPVLIGAQTIADSEQLADRLTRDGLEFQFLNGKQDANEASIVSCAGEKGRVTLATNMAGRGTDIRLEPGVAQLGGLHVIAVEPHDSRRVDRQLAGRAARQGDPGSWRLFVSAEDRLLTAHAPPLARRIRSTADASAELTHLLRHIHATQQRAERQAVVQRALLLNQDTRRNELIAAIE